MKTASAFIGAAVVAASLALAAPPPRARHRRQGCPMPSPPPPRPRCNRIQCAQEHAIGPRCRPRITHRHRHRRRLLQQAGHRRHDHTVGILQACYVVASGRSRRPRAPSNLRRPRRPLATPILPSTPSQYRPCQLGAMSPTSGT